MTTLTVAEFKAWKAGMVRRDVARARLARIAGHRDRAAWYLSLAAMARRTIQEAGE